MLFMHGTESNFILGRSTNKLGHMHTIVWLYSVRWVSTQILIIFMFTCDHCMWYCLSQYLGSFIFLAIEGGASTMQQRTLASTNRQLLRPPPQSRLDNVSLSQLSQATVNEATEARQRTVENIWDITVSLNILYRENWTR